MPISEISPVSNSLKKKISISNLRLLSVYQVSGTVLSVLLVLIVTLLWGCYKN